MAAIVNGRGKERPSRDVPSGLDKIVFLAQRRRDAEVFFDPVHRTNDTIFIPLH